MSAEFWAIIGVGVGLAIFLVVAGLGLFNSAMKRIGEVLGQRNNAVPANEPRDFWAIVSVGIGLAALVLITGLRDEITELRSKVLQLQTPVAPSE